MAEEKVKKTKENESKSSKDTAKNYHVAKRPDGKWQVKFAGGEKAIKLLQCLNYKPEDIKNKDKLSKIKEEFEVPIVTDFHESNQASEVAKVADVLQIPAFLCRQTDMLTSAAKTGKIVNIKKGQFLSPYQMESLAKKVLDCDNDKILITERGTSFGYNNLVVDMRSIEIIQDMGYPVVFDATHSVQLPGGRGESSGGERRFVPLLARSAIVSGARALFFEIHPCPDCAKCDGDNMIALDDAYKLFKNLKDLFELSKKII